MTGPDPNSLHPIKDYDKLVFLKNFIKASNISVGDYTYFDDRRYGADKFEEYNVLYNYDFSKVKLIIGKFCAIAAGNPAKVVKMRFDDQTINRLQKIAWWDWSIEKINKHLKLLCHLDIDQLEIASHE